MPSIGVSANIARIRIAALSRENFLPSKTECFTWRDFALLVRAVAL